MMNNSTIHYDTAIYWQKKEQVQSIVNKEQILQEIKETCIEMLDATDINYYAQEAGISPNEVRGLMIKPKDPQDRFMAEINSFQDDKTDSIFNYY